MTASQDERELLEANQSFYVAFSGLDLELMEQVWAGEADDLCVHPNWPPLHGWPAIRDSWAKIFENTPEMPFVLTNERPSIEEGGSVGHVDLIENIRTPDGSLTGIAARNSFRRRDQRWVMTAHVTAPLPKDQET